MMMKIEQGACGTAVAPKSMESTGFGPCIGVAVIYEGRGFVLHSQDILVEESVTKEFCSLLDEYVPRDARSTLSPVVCGGSLCLYGMGRENDEASWRATRLCREATLTLLAGLGFGEPQVCWARGNESHSLKLDLSTQRIKLKIDSERDDARDSMVQEFRCDAGPA